MAQDCCSVNSRLKIPLISTSINTSQDAAQEVTVHLSF